MVDTRDRNDKYGPVYHRAHNQNCCPAAGGVTRSAELNHVESACGESPNTSPLTPHCPTHTQTKSLTHRPPPVPTFRRLWSENNIPITDWTSGTSLTETNIMLLAHVWEWCNSGGRAEAAAGVRVISDIALHIPARIGKRGQRKGSFMNMSHADTLVCLCVVRLLKHTEISQNIPGSDSDLQIRVGAVFPSCSGKSN